MTNRASISVNGKQVANKLFRSKTEDDLQYQIIYWMEDTELTIRATLKIAGAETATILVADDIYKIEYEWIASGDDDYGSIRNPAG